MPTYSYVFNRGGRLDRVTLDMPDNSIAWHEAVKSLSETLNDIDGRLGHEETIELVVRDQDGHAIWELECRSRCKVSGGGQPERNVDGTDQGCGERPDDSD